MNRIPKVRNLGVSRMRRGTPPDPLSGIFNQPQAPQERDLSGYRNERDRRLGEPMPSIPSQGVRHDRRNQVAPMQPIPGTLPQSQPQMNPQRRTEQAQANQVGPRIMPREKWDKLGGDVEQMLDAFRPEPPADAKRHARSAKASAITDALGQLGSLYSSINHGPAQTPTMRHRDHLSKYEQMLANYEDQKRAHDHMALQQAIRDGQSYRDYAVGEKQRHQGLDDQGYAFDRREDLAILQGEQTRKTQEERAGFTAEELDRREEHRVAGDDRAADATADTFDARSGLSQQEHDQRMREIAARNQGHTAGTGGAGGAGATDGQARIPLKDPRTGKPVIEEGLTESQHQWVMDQTLDWLMQQDENDLSIRDRQLIQERQNITSDDRAQLASRHWNKVPHLRERFGLDPLEEDKSQLPFNEQIRRRAEQAGTHSGPAITGGTPQGRGTPATPVDQHGRPLPSYTTLPRQSQQAVVDSMAADPSAPTQNKDEIRKILERQDPQTLQEILSTYGL